MLVPLKNAPEFVLRGYATTPEDRLPASEIHATEDSYLLTLEIPGYVVADLDVVFAHDILTISGGRCEKGRDLGFERRFSFRALDVTGEGIQASMEDGILTLMVPKIERMNEPKKIEIESVNPSSG